MEMPEYRFKGLLQAEGLNGEVSITIAEDALLFTSLFDQLVCLYADIQAFTIEGYSLVIDTAFGQLKISQLGHTLEWLFDKLWDAYNDAVQKALFVDGTPLYESRGEYCYADEGGHSEGIAVVRLFDNCLCILPPNEEARRVPFCFLRELKEENYSLLLTLDTGESYTFRRLGGYQEGFTHQLTQCLQTLQNRSQKTVREIGGGLNSLQLNAISRRMPEGIAAPLGELDAICPAFTQAVERQIALSRAAEPYLFFKKICGTADICVGLKPAGQSEGALEEAERPEKTPYVIFIVASRPGPNEGVAAVELAIPAEEAAATFFYRYQGEWTAFKHKLNRAMEAVNFRREAIWLKEEALNKPENAHYRMAIRRIAALRFLRGCFTGRVIHSSPEAWQRAVEQQFNGARE